MRPMLARSFRFPPGFSGDSERVCDYCSLVNNALYFRHHERLYEIRDRRITGVANCGESLVQIGVQIRAHVLALEAHAAGPPGYESGLKRSLP